MFSKLKKKNLIYHQIIVCVLKSKKFKEFYKVSLNQSEILFFFVTINFFQSNPDALFYPQILLIM